MDIDKLLEAIERLCLNIIIDIILLPKTLWKLFVSFKNPFDLVMKEMEDPKSPFVQIMSPIRLSLYTSVVISVLVFKKTDHEHILSHVLALLNLVEKSVIMFLFNNIATVLTSIYIISANKQQIPGTEFKSVLFSFIYTSIYISVPFNLLYVGLSLLGGKLSINFIQMHLQAGDLNHIFIFLMVCLIFALIGLYKWLRSIYYIIQNSLLNKSQIIYVLIFNLLIEFLMLAVEFF